MELLLKNHTNPGDWVLVVGAGAGGEVLGAIAAGLNVVAVERDPRQFKALKGRLNQLVVENEANLSAPKQKMKKKSKKKISEEKQQPEEEAPGSGSVGGSCTVCGKMSSDLQDLAQCVSCSCVLHKKCTQSESAGVFLCAKTCLSNQ